MLSSRNKTGTNIENKYQNDHDVWSPINDMLFGWTKTNNTANYNDCSLT